MKYMGNRLDSGSNFHNAQEKCLKGRRKNRNLGDELRKDGKKHDITAYFYHYFKRSHHRFIKGAALLRFRHKGGTRGQDSIGGLGQKSHRNQRQVDGDKQQGHRNRGIHGSRHIAQQEHGAWMVADGQKILAFRSSNPALISKFAAGFGSHRIAAQKSAHEYITSGIRQMQEAAQQRTERSSQEMDSI